MSEASATTAGLDALAATAWTLEPPQPHEMKDLRRDDAAFLLDGLLGRLARGRGALDVAIGDGLAALGTGDRVLRLGFSCLGDYARERLGIAGSTAEKLARLARALRERPLLRDAVWRGEVSARKAEAVLPAARGDGEAEWVSRARVETVRALDAAVKEALASRGTDDGADEDEVWDRVEVELAPEQRAKLDRAMALAGALLGATSPRWQRLEAICAEFLSEHPVELPEDDAGTLPAWRRCAGEPDDLKAWLERETRSWAFLEKFEPVPAPEQAGWPVSARERAGTPVSAESPWRVDEDLLRLATMRARWDEVFGHVAMLLRLCGLWRDMQFASFAHYCAERLGMAERTVAQRIALERRLWDLPELRQAMRDGRVSYEKARLVARAATPQTAGSWIARAEQSPCVALRREIEANDEAQMCARGDLSLRVPARVAALVRAVFRAVRGAEGRWVPAGACLERAAEHFIETWEAALAQRKTRQRRVLARDRGFCQVPGCSRPAAHVHHVLFRSLGGRDEDENLVSLCAAHHLHGVHLGWIRVRGRAPDGLTWELGVRAGAPPLAVLA